MTLEVCSLSEWCFIISIDNCWDWFQSTYVLCGGHLLVTLEVCSLLEWCFIISIDNCWDWFQSTYVLCGGHLLVTLESVPY